MRKSILFLLTALLCSCLSASANRGGFYYENVDIDAVVFKNNTWDVTETFDIVFEQPRHGFYRYIPRTFKLWHDVSADEGKPGREDLREFPYVSKIDRISVPGWKYTTEDSNEDFCIVRIGDADREVTGRQRYIVKYTYSYSDDRRPAFDYLYHTVLGTDFEQPIEHFSFTIRFDKPLPDDITDSLRIYAGEYGKTAATMQNLSIEATPALIRGEASDVAPGRGVTLYAKLPAGYYEDTRQVNYFWHYLFLALTVITGILLAWLLFRIRKPEVTKVIEFYPPEDICSAEVGTIIDTSVDDVDVASLIPWLAGKGYISIKETTKGKLIKRTDLKLTKLQDLPHNAPGYQKKLMKLLFSKGDTVSMRGIGDKSEEMEDIKKSLDDRFKGKKQLTVTKSAVWLYVPYSLFAALTLATNGVAETWEDQMLLFAGFLFWIPFAVGVFMRLSQSGSDLIKGSFRHVLTFLGKAVVMTVCFLLYWLLGIEYGAPMGVLSAGLLYAASFLLGELAGRFIVDTDYRAMLMGRLLGFKEFIETAEKPQLEQLQADDPQYFYKVLPFAMVFGLSDKWADLFKDIELERPVWYESSSQLMGSSFTNHLTSSLCSTTQSTISTISHDSSSSSGGGGFSGGGGGGGGGGSW